MRSLFITLMSTGHMPHISPTIGTSSDPHPLIVHSHLRWDFVWQRPQQILSRFARTRPVLYVEEPVFADDITSGALDVSRPTTGVFRVVPRLPGDLRGANDEAEERVRALLLRLIMERGSLAHRFDNPVQWFYTPMPARVMLGAFSECAVVYDCMDELAQFRFAPPDLAARERMLLACADVVFTGGSKLYESKAKHHRNVHFFGCGVDADHFALAYDAETRVPRTLWSVASPVLGYFGVIDERLDYDLIAKLADAFPDGTLVFVGPLAKVQPNELPRRSNILWLGQQPYASLPSYVKAFDVCLMPFALNEATEFINPTKTLEYLAAGKPVVSTAVPDVARNFASLVRVANSADEFVRETKLALVPDAERIEEGVARARASSWDAIVAQMDRLIVTAADSSEASAQVQVLHSAAERIAANRTRSTGEGAAAAG